MCEYACGREFESERVLTNGISMLSLLYPFDQLCPYYNHYPLFQSLSCCVSPGLRDDYYLNLLSWGVNNTIAIALHNSGMSIIELLYTLHNISGK